jgi:hypothetical protein
MLKAVIKDVDVHVETFFGEAAGTVTVRSHGDGHFGQRSRQQRGLVTHLSGVGRALRSGLEQDDFRPPLSSVSPGENAGFQAVVQQAFGDELDQGSLPCTSQA